MVVLDRDEFYENEPFADLNKEHRKADNMIGSVLKRIYSREKYSSFICEVDKANLLSGASDVERRKFLNSHFGYVCKDLNENQVYRVLQRKYVEANQVLKNK